MNEDSSDVHQASCEFNFTSFMFGNVDENGQLEDDDILDNDSKKYLASLSKLGFNSVVSEVIDSSELHEYNNGQVDINGLNEKSETAEDFFDMDEVCAEEATNIKQEVSENGYDGDSEHNDKKIDKSKRLETPLAAMLPSKYENVDVTTLFPDFRVGKVILIHNIMLFPIRLFIFN